MELSEAAAVAERLRRNKLAAGSGLSSAELVVKAICGVQAQDLPAGRLSLRPRSRGLTDAAVETARAEERSVVRTWAMRGTLHLVASSDLLWLRRLLAPGSIRANARRSAELGLDEPAYRQALDMMDDALSGRSLSRLALKEALEQRGVDASGQRMVYLLARASAEGLICEGPLEGRFPTYVRVGDWLNLIQPETADRSADLDRLVDRYLGAYGPAGPEDLSAWSGLSLTECRQAFYAAGGLAKLVVDGRTVWITGELQDAEPPLLVLLPAFDTFLLGYRDRSLHLDKVHTRRVNAGGGMVKPVVLAGGRVAGTWSIKRTSGRLGVAVDPFSKLPAPTLPALEAEVADLGRFLGVTAELDLRPAGPA